MAASFVALVMIPVDFNYWVFAVLVFLNGLGGGIFTAPNTAAIMSSVPAAAARCRVGCAGDVLQRRLVAVDRHLLLADDHWAGQHAAERDELPGCRSRACPRPWPTTSRICHRSAACSRRSWATTRSPSCWQPSGALQQPGVNADVLTGKTFFPQLITEPFHSGSDRGVHRRGGDDGDRRDRVDVQPGPLRDEPGADNEA